MASLSAVTVVLPCPCKHIALLHWWLLTGLVDSSIIAGPMVTMFGTYSMGQAAFGSGRGRFLQRILCQFPATQSARLQYFPPKHCSSAGPAQHCRSGSAENSMCPIVSPALRAASHKRILTRGPQIAVMHTCQQPTAVHQPFQGSWWCRKTPFWGGVAAGPSCLPGKGGGGAQPHCQLRQR